MRRGNRKGSAVISVHRTMYFDAGGVLTWVGETALGKNNNAFACFVFGSLLGLLRGGVLGLPAAMFLLSADQRNVGELVVLATMIGDFF